MKIRQARDAYAWMLMDIREPQQAASSSARATCRELALGWATYNGDHM